MATETLSRENLLAILGIVLSIIGAVYPMTWWIKLLFMVAATCLVVYVVPRLQFTIKLCPLCKVSLSILAFLVMAFISSYPIQKQWEKDHAPKPLKEHPKQPTAQEKKKNNILENKQKIPAPQESRFPFVDIELRRGDGYEYDIYVHNKSSVTLAKIVISRIVNPEKNKPKMVLRGQFEGKLKYFYKTINVLGPGEGEKIHREFLPSWEYTIFTVIYLDDSGRQYKCIFGGDRDGLKLTSHSIIPPSS